MSRTTAMGDPTTKGAQRKNRAREMLLKAIVRNASKLRDAPAEVQTNEGFLLEAIEQNATVVEYVRKDLRNDRDFALRAVAANARALWHLPLHLQQCAEVIVAAVAKQGAAVHTCDEDVKDGDANAPTIAYYLRVLRSSRTAVQEIRDEIETEAEAERVAAARREDRLSAEVAALTAKNRCLETQLKKKKNAASSSSSKNNLWDSVSHSEDLCANALHLETLRVNALQTKVQKLADLAITAGADATTVNAVKSKPLQATTVSVT
mmetsp:Transcript_41/g.118  ORF Transcript_41/g.118 Transcript_41/m.118 type:complete len:264 (+) Transcript_41:143-934(+)